MQKRFNQWVFRCVGFGWIRKVRVIFAFIFPITNELVL